MTERKNPPTTDPKKTESQTMSNDTRRELESLFDLPNTSKPWATRVSEQKNATDTKKRSRENS
jgi:hypothetical protein